MYKGQTVEFNFPEQTAAKASTKLDMRFADEEDAGDIECVLRISDSCEYDETSHLCFRKSAETEEGNVKISKEEIADECNKSNIRWIVMETPVPEEQVVGAARLRLPSHSSPESFGDSPAESDASKARVATVDIFVYFPDDKNRSVRSQLLAQLERIAVGQGVDTLIIEVLQHRTDVQEWLTTDCGYIELGGRLCEEKNIAKPTMIFEFHKNLRISRAISVASTAVVSSSAIIDSKVSVDDADDGGDVFDFASLSLADVEFVGGAAHASAPNSATGSDPMRGLVGDLFAALHREAGTKD